MSINSFNEAAARCRGKPAHLVGDPAVRRASMRPRPDAAENRNPHDRIRGPVAASMRPRPDAAENTGLLAARAGPQHASMRPRPDAAENAAGRAGRRRRRRASMRPRPDAAENTRDLVVRGRVCAVLQ